MKRIIYTRPDGGVSVVTPVINTHTMVGGKVVAIAESITEDEAVTRAMNSVPATAQNVQIVDEADIPKDRTNRNNWKFAAGKITEL